MASISTEEAIRNCLKALWRNTPTTLIKHELLLHGFKNNKANVILRWAMQFQKKFPAPKGKKK